MKAKIKFNMKTMMKMKENGRARTDEIKLGNN